VSVCKKYRKQHNIENNKKMKTIRDSCIEFFQNEDIRMNIREIIKPLGNLMYNEIYLYVWFICIYNVFLLFLVLVNLFLVIKLFYTQNQSVKTFENPLNYI
jgi:hypothetical protein